jgi:hypothetical protein
MLTKTIFLRKPTKRAPIPPVGRNQKWARFSALGRGEGLEGPRRSGRSRALRIQRVEGLLFTRSDPAFARPCSHCWSELAPPYLFHGQESGVWAANSGSGGGGQRHDPPPAGQTSVEASPLAPCERRGATDARIKARILISRRAGQMRRILAGCRLTCRVGNGAPVRGHRRAIAEALQLHGARIHSDEATRAEKIRRHVHRSGGRR